ncbi:MAG: PstS family phosphate ABC transporter substrate-binding protein [Acidobacteria bacterium]|nr:PstS family phosphate ABC transporter substrate-binding protein [Acidobacteriota bacterium]
MGRKAVNQIRWAAIVLTLASLGCGRTGEPTGGGGEIGRLQGMVKIDGSSTVYPITEAVAEEFQKTQPEVRVTVGIAGTGGGFKRFTAGETDISDASRPIDPSEAEIAAKNNIEFIELPVGFDGLSVLVNPANDFVSSLTVAELKQIWEPESKVKRWSDVRKQWPAREIHLFGPGTDSGTFDYFTEAINGKAKAMRADFNASEDDNVLVQGIEGDKDALGFFGYAYYVENKDRLKLISVDGGNGPVAPSPDTIRDGSYNPLSRPVFIYVSAKAASRPEVEAFVKFYLEHASKLVAEVGYVALPDSIYELVRQRYQARKTGSVFANKGAQVGVTLESLLKAEQ